MVRFIHVTADSSGGKPTLKVNKGAVEPFVPHTPDIAKTEQTPPNFAHYGLSKILMSRPTYPIPPYPTDLVSTPSMSTTEICHCSIEAAPHIINTSPYGDAIFHNRLQHLDQLHRVSVQLRDLTTQYVDLERQLAEADQSRIEWEYRKGEESVQELIAGGMGTNILLDQAMERAQKTGDQMLTHQAELDGMLKRIKWERERAQVRVDLNKFLVEDYKIMFAKRTGRPVPISGNVDKRMRELRNNVGEVAATTTVLNFSGGSEAIEQQEENLNEGREEKGKRKRRSSKAFLEYTPKPKNKRTSVKEVENIGGRPELSN